MELGGVELLENFRQSNIVKSLKQGNLMQLFNRK